MNKSLILFLIISLGLSTVTLSQNVSKKKIKLDKKNLEFYNKVDLGDLKPFDNNVAPEKYKDVSTVVLANKIYLSLTKKKARGILRKRILLQDDNAIKNYAEYYYQESETSLLILTKKDGEEVEIDMKQAILSSTDVPDRYRNRFQSSAYYKLAIPNLEVGDILDFITIFTNNANSEFSYIDKINDEVPVLSESVIFDVNEDYKVVQNTFLTDIKFKVNKKKGFDSDGEFSPEMNRFVFEANMLDADEGEMWRDFYSSVPHVKFYAISKRSLYYPKLENQEVMAKLPLEDCMRAYWKSIGTDYNPPFFNEIARELKKYDDDNISDEELAYKAYYIVRSRYTNMLEPSIATNSIKNFGETYDQIYSNATDYSMNDLYFLVALSNALEKRHFEVQYVGLAQQSIQDLKNLVSLDELIFGIYLPSLKMYFFSPNKDRNHLDVPFSINEGGIGLALNIDAIKKNNGKAETITFTAPSSDINYDINKIKLDINVEDPLATVSKEVSMDGVVKSRNNYLIEKFSTYLLEDKAEALMKSNALDEISDYKKDLEKDKYKLYKSSYSKSQENQKKAFEHYIENTDFKTKLISHKITSRGRTPNHKTLDIEIKYTSEDLVKKLGSNLLVNLGYLIDHQYAIDEKNKLKRKAAFNFDYSRKYNYEISLSIPEGYYIENFDNLVKSKDTPYCSFNSSAELNGNTLLVKTTKNYKVIYAPVDAWGEITEVMDLAYKFSQEKVVLKKK